MIPIILAHGIARFDILLDIQRRKFNLPDDKFSDEFQYFKGIKSHLEANGFQNVFRSNQDFAGPVNMRAEQLKDQVNDILEKSGAEKVHIIAHSMGGLDARRMIVDFGMEHRVASLTTIGTPHLGTILADRVIGFGGFLLIEALKNIFRIEAGGFNDLTVSACEEFNRRAEHREATNPVLYQTYSSSEEVKDVFIPLVVSWKILNSQAGPNDGLVPVVSQQWAKELIADDGRRKTIVQKSFPIPADHLNEIGWWDFEELLDPQTGGDPLAQKIHFEDRIKAIYLEIARDLQERFE